MTQKIAIIAGDGIGPEVTAEAIKVLSSAIPPETFELIHYDLGADRWLRTGEVLPDSVLNELDHVDAILLGAVGGDPRSHTLPSGLLERGLLLKLRFTFDQGVNMRPAHLYDGVTSPLSDAIINQGPIDFVVIREGTEGLYSGVGGCLARNTDHEIATEESINTAAGTRRVILDAFHRAKHRNKHVTLLHKSNVLNFAGGLWSRVFDEVATEFPDVRTDYLHVDAATIAMVRNPQQFDVIVTDNLFGDIITDLAAAVTGGIGLAASGNINVERQHPSMFEPVHGSAPDIAGQGIADPTASILSTALMLEHLGYVSASHAICQAVEEDLATRGSEPRRTATIGDALAERVALNSTI